MFQDALTYMLISFAVLIVLPLVVHFPVYLYRFPKMCQFAAIKGPQFNPSERLLVLNVWLIAALIGIFCVRPMGVVFQSQAKTAEAEQNLRAIYKAEMAYRKDHGQFAGREEIDTTGAFKDLRWEPQGTTHFYSFYVGGDFIPPTITKGYQSFDPTAPKVYPEYLPGPNWPLTLQPAVSDQGFTAIAIGNIDRDPCLDIWAINDANKLRHLVADIGNASRPGVCRQCPGIGKSILINTIRWWLVRTRIFEIGLCFFALLGYTSPFMLIFVPIMYVLAIRQNRLYQAAMVKAETVDSSA